MPGKVIRSCPTHSHSKRVSAPARRNVISINFVAATELMWVLLRLRETLSSNSGTCTQSMVLWCRAMPLGESSPSSSCAGFCPLSIHCLLIARLKTWNSNFWHLRARSNFDPSEMSSIAFATIRRPPFVPFQMTQRGSGRNHTHDLIIQFQSIFSEGRRFNRWCL